MATKFEGAPVNYKQRFLDCKSWGHAWRHRTDFHLVRNVGGQIIQFTRQTVCGHCTTERHVIFDKTMHVVSSRYVYPDGYQTGGEAVIDVVTARNEFVRRLLVKAGDAPGVPANDLSIDTEEDTELQDHLERQQEGLEGGEAAHSA